MKHSLLVNGEQKIAKGDFMNKFFSFVFIFAILISAVSASETVSLSGVTFKVDKTEYLVEAGDDIEVEITTDPVFYQGTRTNEEYKIEIDFKDEDEQEYFEIRKSVIESEFCENTSGIKYACDLTQEFKIVLSDDIPEDDYTIYLEFSSGNESSRVPITIDVGEHDDDLDVTLKDDSVCLNDTPYKGTLIFENSSSSDYYVDFEVKSSEFWPRIKDDEVRVDEDETRHVYIEFLRFLDVGEYEIEVEGTYRKTGSSTEKEFKKDVEFRVEDCSRDSFNVSLRTENVTLRTGQTGKVNYTITNNANSSQIVYVSALSDSFVFPNNNTSITVRANSSMAGSFDIKPTENAQNGNQTIELLFSGDYSNVYKSANVNVRRETVDITYERMNVRYGTKGIIPITITNSATTTKSIKLSTQGNATLDASNITILPNQKKVIKASVDAQSIGEKNFILVLSGDSNQFMEIVYNVSNSVQNINIVLNYTRNIEMERNTSAPLQIEFYNPENYPISVTTQLGNSQGIESETLNFTLGAKERVAKTMNIRNNFAEPKRVEASLDIFSDISAKNYPLFIGVDMPASDIEGLELVNVQEKYSYVKGKNTELVFNVRNSNSKAIDGAIIKVIVNGEEKSVQGFRINAFETREVKLNVNLNYDKDTIAKVEVSAQNSKKSYETILTQSSNFTLVPTGLFSLSETSTLGMIIGLVILIVLTVFIFFEDVRPKLSTN